MDNKDLREILLTRIPERADDISVAGEQIVFTMPVGWTPSSVSGIFWGPDGSAANVWQYRR